MFSLNCCVVNTDTVTCYRIVEAAALKPNISRSEVNETDYLQTFELEKVIRQPQFNIRRSYISDMHVEIKQLLEIQDQFGIKENEPKNPIILSC